MTQDENKCCIICRDPMGKKDHTMCLDLLVKDNQMFQKDLIRLWIKRTQDILEEEILNRKKKKNVSV